MSNMDPPPGRAPALGTISNRLQSECRTPGTSSQACPNHSLLTEKKRVAHRTILSLPENGALQTGHPEGNLLSHFATRLAIMWLQQWITKLENLACNRYADLLIGSYRSIFNGEYQILLTDPKANPGRSMCPLAECSLIGS